MNKKDKLNLKNRLFNENLNKKDKRLIIDLSIVKPIIYLVLLLVLFIVSLVYNKKLTKFSHLMFNNPNISISLMVAYYLFMIVAMIIAIYTLAIGLYSLHNKNDKRLYKLGDFYDTWVFFINAISIVFFVLVYLFTPCVVSGESMEQTLSDGDRLVLWNFNSSYEKDDIIVFDGINYVDDDVMVIKRVVAKEGDTFRYDNQTTMFYVNEQEVGYITIREYMVISLNLTTTVVPKGKILAFGDNRDNSLDSRSFGFIDLDDVYGKVILRLFPFNKMSFLG